MNNGQKTVAIGAASGVALMALSVWGLYSIVPDPGAVDMIDRLAFTLRLNVLALVPLFILIVTVGNQRFLSEAIDPLRHAENTKMEINGRVVENTLQQQFIFCVGTLALSTLLTATSIKLIAALTTVYIVARVIFWIGYHINPLYRAPGMAATGYMNLGIIAAVLYLTFF